MARHTLLALAVLAGCATKTDPSAASSPPVTSASSGPADSDAKSETEIPDAPPPIAGDPLAGVELPCAEPSACQARARFGETVTLLSPSGMVIVASASTQVRPPSPFGPPRVLVGPTEQPKPGEPVAVVCSSEVLSIQLQVEYDGLLPVATEFVLAKPQPSAKDDVGISLAPGSVVEVGKKKNGQQEVFMRGELEARGWVPESSLGRTYLAAESDPRVLPDTLTLIRAKDSIAVRSRPGGPEFGRISGFASVHRLSDISRGQVKVAVTELFAPEGIHLIGWVPDEQIDANATGILGGMIAPTGPSASFLVPRGARLETMTGEEVAIATDDAPLRCVSDCATETPTVQLACVAEFPARVRRAAPR
ncbi:MAG: hypothetical protein ACRBN8_40390 [Nannocystales bacterium]